jgi:ligand-binding sensor domain-containing protein
MRRYASRKWIVLFIAGMLYSRAATGQLSEFLWQRDTIHMTVEKEQYITTMIGAKDGLLSSEILCLFQDSKGFVWIGTSIGISKYDGYTFENHITAGNKQLGKINKVVEDPLRELIWIMSDAGLAYYQNGTLQLLSFEEEDITVYDMSIDGNGACWIATAKGPVYFTQKEMQHLIHTGKGHIDTRLLPGWKSSLKEDSLIRLIKTDSRGRVWLASKNTVYCHDGNHTKQVWRSSSFNDMINTIMPAKNKTFFVSTMQGIFVCDNENNVSPVPFEPTISANIYDGGNALYYMCLEGIYRFDPEQYAFTFLSRIPDDITKWLSCVLVDREKNIWIGMHDALLFQRKRLFYEYRSNVNIEMFCGLQKKDNVVLLGGNRGKVYQKNGMVLSNFLGKGNSICSKSTLSAIYEDSRGWIWYGTAYQGIAVERQGKFRYFDKENGLGNNQNYFFLETSAGDIWTGGDGFLTRLSKQNGSDSIACTSYASLLSGDNWLVFRNAVEGPGNTIWAAGARGLFKYHNEQLSHYSLSDSTPINISDIKKSVNNEVWLTTMGNGIWQCYFDSRGLLQLKKKYGTGEGLNADSYLNLLIDEQNNIWAVSYSGISKITTHKENYSISNYTIADGFPDRNYQSAKLLQDKDNKIWVITSAGLSCFNPGDAEQPDKKPLIVLNTVKTPDSIYYTPQHLPGTPSLVLSYNKNELTFNLSGIYFTNPAAVKYLYRLSGNDTTWKDGGNNRTIHFEGLRPGNYILQAKALVGNTESDTIAACSFIVKKPFWQTWWFNTTGALLIAAWVYIWIKQKEKKIKKAAAEKNAIQMHIAELETKALKSQMNPHFVFNSLNAIAQLIASSQNERGIQYLSKFSRLLRIILDESENNFIVLKDEIKMLDLYLQIEAMRFGDSFTYDIYTDDNIEEEDISVPALLLHPLVENAVWHGLLHKQGQRSLIVHFRKISEDILQCTVKDNGIGIAAAKEMKEKRLNGVIQKSKGIQLVKDRLRTLEQQYGKPTFFCIEDMNTGQYSSGGTLVTIQFPVLYES